MIAIDIEVIDEVMVDVTIDELPQHLEADDEVLDINELIDDDELEKCEFLL